jgi:hypothetical protein
MKYPEIEVELTGQNGNAFAIMAAVTSALRRNGVTQAEAKQYQAEAMSGDYDHLMQVTMDWVEVS